MTILIFGDSISHGYNDNVDFGWASLLRKKLGDLEDFYNLSISGDTTKDLLEYFEVDCKSRMRFSTDIKIIFAIGINDSRYLNDSLNLETSLEDFKINLDRLFLLSKKFTNNVTVLGLTKIDDSKTTPIPWSKDKFYTNENSKKFNEILKETSLQSNFKFIDLFETVNLEDLDDGLHPNNLGHKKIFEKIISFL